MDIYDKLKNALLLLTDDGKYTIKEVDYNSGCFGNIWVVLKSKNGLNVQFVRDRGIMSCSFGLGTKALDKWLYIKDVFTILGINFPSLPSETFDYIRLVCELIRENEIILKELNNPGYFKKLYKNIFENNKNRFMKEKFDK